jgi:cardiolipin synthase
MMPPPAVARSIVVWAGPEGGANAMKLLYLLAIAAAKTTLDIESPYLTLDESTRWSLADARRRGVRIRIIMESDITDAKPVKFASRAAYDELLEQGIEVYEYTPAMMHTKAIVIDGVPGIVAPPASTTARWN